ncbi:MmcQ/YjbR family DNA-binding protein [Stenotrophomonas bentonitica]|uniref:MmcQ/YjbR family DNA-binding protein n=1 Tax=Stenotrophomonas bentonitica TaxID=1450134 RepID=UPI000C9C0C42|nr:MmcQ/YjbR family DNA-binding protein [Stenotrophomonas bentonitica]
MINHNNVFAYAKKKYGVDPDHPFERFPDYAVLRHVDSEKWFALLMVVPRTKLGLEGDGDLEIIDLKVAAEKVGNLRTRDGFLPAYHMNKEHWLTIALNGAVSASEIYALLDESYELTK